MAGFRGTEIGAYVQRLSTSELEEIRCEALNAVAKLPSKESFVWGVFINHFLETGARPSERDSMPWSARSQDKKLLSPQPSGR